jgi:dihydroorotase-like cyclic amidohydrolase
MSMTVLKNATLSDGSRADITIEGQMVTAIGSSMAPGIDCSGLIAMPAFVDVHTHLREPGFEARHLTKKFIQTLTKCMNVKYTLEQLI